jgi:putative spermidine/putrescine transport system permease protein
MSTLDGAAVTPGALGVLSSPRSAGAGDAGAPAARSRWSTLRPRLVAASGLLPFAAYTAIFLGAPTVAIIVGAFQKPTGGFTFSNLNIALHGVYLHGFETSLELAVFAAVIPGIFGVVLAYAIHTSLGGLLKRLTSTASGVFANFGGVPLAFFFISTLGTTGIATRILNAMGFDPYLHGFSLYTFTGIAIVYAYFQIPLMVLVITPALGGLRPAWKEAADNLGARSWQFWRYVGGPVLAPSFLGALLLLFGSSLSAYATAEALTSGSVALTPIQIGTFLNGNVIPGQQNVGKALGFGLVVIIGVVMVAYAFLQRRASKWLR